jgi:hypothetical protein
MSDSIFYHAHNKYLFIYSIVCAGGKVAIANKNNIFVHFFISCNNENEGEKSLFV